MRKLGMTALVAAVVIVSAGAAIGGCGKSAEKTAQEQRQSIEESAMQAYLETESTGGAQDKVPDPNVPKLEVVSVFVPSETGIQKEMDAINILDAKELFAKMKEYEAVPAEAELLSFVQEGEQGKLELKGVDLSNEALAVAVGNTFIENFELKTLSLKAGELSMEMKYNTDYKNLKK